MWRSPARVVERIGRRLPARSVRVRLTALYGSLFLLCGAALLVITYLLVSRATAIRAVATSSPGGRPAPGAVVHTHLVDLHQLLVQSGVALAIMTVVSGVLGWVVAGRVLSPLRTITARTRQISKESLHDRLALQGPRDELTELADTIDELLARLEAAFDAQRRFVANASHEMRTPLTIMRTTLEVAAAKPDGVPAKPKVLEAALIEDLDHAERLLESFLVLSRAEHGELGEQSLVSLKGLIAAALAGQAEELAAKEIAVRTVPTDARVLGSETLLARMVENVIENAVRHNQPHGVIEIACEIDGEQAWLLIDSTGPFLEEDRVAQLAQPFKRLGRDRTGSDHGHGLGLSIVAAIAAAHHGRLELHARPQGGLSVRIALPTRKSAELAAGRA
jgi:signal transduction histidine kinase